MAKAEKVCGECKARCCRYVTVEIDEPETGDDFDDMRWYVSHEGCAVYREDGHWFFEVLRPCENLAENDLCTIYPRRPSICRSHNPKGCEESGGEFAWDLRLETIQDVEDYARLVMQSRYKRSGKFVAPWDRRAKKYEREQKAKKTKKKR